MDDQFAQQARREYLENKVFSAHPVERVQMLYQIAIESVNTAIAREMAAFMWAIAREVRPKTA